MLEAKPERFLKFLNILLKLEGGAVDNPLDKGGATNLGVTQQTYSLFLSKYNLPSQSVKKITKSQVEDIYFENYYSRVNYIEDEYPHFLVFDLAVNSGPGKAQQCIRDVSNPHDPAAILSFRRQLYNTIVKNNPMQKVFLNGWMNRLKLIQKEFEGKDDTT